MAPNPEAETLSTTEKKYGDASVKAVDLDTPCPGSLEPLASGPSRFLELPAWGPATPSPGRLIWN